MNEVGIALDALVKSNFSIPIFSTSCLDATSSILQWPSAVMASLSSASL